MHNHSEKIAEKDGEIPVSIRNQSILTPAVRKKTNVSAVGTIAKKHRIKSAVPGTPGDKF